MPLLSAGRTPAKAGLPETFPWLLLLLESWAWQTLPSFGEIQAHFDQVRVNTVVSLRALEKHAGRHTVLILLLRMETRKSRLVTNHHTTRRRQSRYDDPLRREFVLIACTQGLEAFSRWPCTTLFWPCILSSSSFHVCLSRGHYFSSHIKCFFSSQH